MVSSSSPLIISSLLLPDSVVCCEVILNTTAISEISAMTSTAAISTTTAVFLVFFFKQITSLSEITDFIITHNSQLCNSLIIQTVTKKGHLRFYESVPAALIFYCISVLRFFRSFCLLRSCISIYAFSAVSTSFFITGLNV